MSVHLTTEQVTQMAPDSSSASAGKKLANAKHWKNLGQNEAALWGECQGSALYQVKVDLAALSVQCSCPSRKQPCKHGLGLLLLTVASPNTVPTTEPPEWVATWLQRKAAASQRKETRKVQAADPNAKPSAAQQKTAQKRQALVLQGIDRLDLWLNDLVRNGLSSLETQPAKFWEDQAASMVDAQASGLAVRLRRMAEIPNSSADWPAKLLDHLGQLALLTHAYRRIDQLDPALQEDVRFMVGWPLREEEVIARGTRVSDDWLILGQVNEEASRGTNQRTWLLGTNTQRPALIEQFAPKGSQVPQLLPLGARWQAELCYWPGAAPQRALIVTTHQTHASFNGSFPALATLEAFMEQVASTLALQPWRERFLCTVQNVVPSLDKAGQWYIHDSTGHSLPLISDEHWKLLALSGGQPLDFAGEWNGET
ncbi:MAG: SWIM zinc finger family protein, partial [Ktedonobacteraceae bacterium]|nr:SWIM zinc finger family protein [Ktedonobacteraceae bacterium]